MKIKLLSFLFFLWTGYSFSQTIIPGGVVSGVWTKANSPYLIQAAIMIANATSLTIEPGVRVEFQGSYKFLVLGQLLAIGNAVDTITFTASDTAAGWLGIRFDNTAATNDTSKFWYCKFEYGKATANSPENCGGAFYFYNFNKAVISNSLIQRCAAIANGGGIFCSYSSPEILNNSIINNSAAPNSTNLGGGGIYCIYSSPVIFNNIISNNVTDNSGGGLYISYDSNPLISNNTISNNTVTHYGGGIDVYGNSSHPTIVNNTISNNTASSGGGIYCIYNNPDISNNIISNNLATSWGGGICCYPSSTPTISNNIISNNEALLGGGIFCNSSNPYIINNTISNNEAQKGGGFACLVSSDPSIVNTIMHGNTATTIGNQVYLEDDASDPGFSFSDIQGGDAGFGLNSNVFYLGSYLNNIDSDPLFVAPSIGSGRGFNGAMADWSLQSTSPCINAGNPSGIYPATDIAGNPRISDGIIDIGAYEYQLGTGTHERMNSNSISIYPNPSQDYFIVASDERFKDAQVEVTNMFGQNVLREDIVNLSSKKIFLKNISSGIYMVKITDGAKVFSHKLIVQ